MSFSLSLASLKTTFSEVFSSPVNVLRVLGLLCSSSIIFFWWILPEGVIDPLWQRFVVGGSIMVVVVASYINRRIANFLPEIVFAFALLNTVWMLELAVINSFSELYLTNFYLVNFICLLLFERLLLMRIYALMTVAAAIAFYFIMSVDHDLTFFVLVVVMVNVIGYFATGFRISIQKRLRQAEKAHRRVLQTAVDSNPSGIILFDANGTFLDCNQAFLHMWGLSKEDLVGGDAGSVFTGVLGDLESPQHLQNLLNKGKGTPKPALLRTRGDRYFEVSVKPLQGTDLSEGSLWFFQEMSEVMRDRKKSKEVQDLLRRQNACLTELATNPVLVAGDEEQALMEIARVSAPLIQADKISFWRYDAESEKLVCMLEWLHPAGKANRRGEIPIMHFAEYFGQLSQNRVMAVEDCTQYPYTQVFVEGVGETPTRSMIDVPIRVDGEIKAILSIQNEQEPYQWSPEEQTFAVSLAELASSAMAASARNRLKQGLDRYLAILRTIFDLSGVGILVLDRDSRPMAFNDMFVQSWGLDPDFLQNAPKESVIEFCEQSIREVKQVRIGREGRLKESLIYLHDGRIMERLVAQFHVTDTMDGQVWFFREITDRVRAENQLKSSERRNRLILNAIPDTIIRVHSSGRVVDFKGPISQLVDTVAVEAKEKDLQQVLPGPFADTILKSIKKALKGGQMQSFEYEIDSQSMKGDFQVRVAVMGKEEALVLIQDITERKKIEKELVRRNFELDSFVYRASHDLKAPLNSMMGLLDILSMENQDAALLQYFNLMNKSVVKLDTFIKNLTDFSRNARLELASEAIDLQNTLDEIIDSLQFMEDAGRLQKEINLQQEGSFKADPIRLNIVLSNLISNAIKYQDANKSESRLLIRARVNREEAYFELSDNGVGIDKKYQEKIFGLFFRATNMAFGSGIGLYIVKNAVEKMGGEIHFESEAGKGTTFRIRIPNLAYVQRPLVEMN